MRARVAAAYATAKGRQSESGIPCLRRIALIELVSIRRKKGVRRDDALSIAQFLVFSPYVPGAY